VIKFPCPACSTTISAADEHAGRKGKCPTCQHVMVIPGSTEKPAAAKTAPRPSRESVTPARPNPGPARRRPRDDDDDPPYVAEAVEDDDVEEMAEVRRPRARRRNEEREDEDERPSRRRRVDDELDEDDEPRPRRRRRRARSRWRGEFATCPNCGAPGDATRLYYTMWGGFIGPMLINHVRCNQCGTGYNGTTGEYNTAKIAIFLGASWAVGLVFLAFVIFMQILAH
jgi:hypothetical protein